MSEYTREEILEMIERVGGPEDLDLSGKDLSGIDLSPEAIAKELEEYRKQHLGDTPVWLPRVTEGIELHEANLQKAILREANLQKASLVDTNLRGAELWRAKMQEAKLWGANLQEADLSSANLQGAELVWASLQEANLSNANLNKAALNMANLQNAKLWRANMEEANLTEANLQEAYLARAKLRKAKLQGAHLERVDMYDVKSLDGAYFYGAFLDQTRMRKEQLGEDIGEDIAREYYKAKEAYLLLKNNFNQIGRYDDASWAYIRERQMEKMTYHRKLARTYYAKTESLPEGISPKSWTWWRFYVKYTLKWLWDWIIEWLCGYGERPLNVVAVALGVLIIIFPFLYSLTGLAPRSGQNLLPRDLFLYSLYSFASMEHPTLQATSWIAQLFTGLESLSGIGLLALLMYTLGRRISRS